ncbi:hypothetical protein P3T76_006700 [Phytophthora citrophthora]|uniref:Uncharacterized protein n=1 Tax=Phytophthora citrophthora TaxID=4793 RepID=A0AAD9GNC9_9STRA|nr:hypothetical protein P3T76_006700 [Phytophthora citrophthora]
MQTSAMHESHKKKKNRHVSKPAAARKTSLPTPAASISNSATTSTSHRRDLLGGSIQEVSRKTLMERFRKRGRVESASYANGRDRATANTTLQSNSSSFSNTGPIVLRGGRAPHHATFLVHKNTLARPQSAPNLMEQADDEVITRIFPDICPRELRIAEVKSWESPWMKQEFSVSPEPETKVLEQPQQGELLSNAAETGESVSIVTLTSDQKQPGVLAPSKAVNSNGLHRNTADKAASELDKEINSLTNQLSLEGKRSRPQSPPKKTAWSQTAGTPPPVSTPRTPQWKAVESAKRTPGNRIGKRPQLRLKLEDMPTPQQAEERAHVLPPDSLPSETLWKLLRLLLLLHQDQVHLHKGRVSRSK